MYLQLKSINKSFADTDKETIKDVSLDIKKGEFICIVGPSGCGKSTLLNLVAGFIKPTVRRNYSGRQRSEGTGFGQSSNVSGACALSLA